MITPSIFPCLLTVLVGIVCASLPMSVRAQNLVQDSGLETGAPYWTTPYIPANSEGKGCAFQVINDKPHTGVACGRLTAKEFARFSITPSSRPEVQGGVKYILSVWIRAGKDFQAQPDTQGLVVRVDSADAAGTDAKFRIGIDWKGKRTDAAAPDRGTGEVPQIWTKVESTVTMPPDAGKVRLGLWFESAKGDLFFDDLRFERAN